MIDSLARFVRIVLAILALFGLLLLLMPGEGAEADPSRASMAAGPAEPPIPFIRDDVITARDAGSRARLRKPGAATLMGWLAPLAVPSPDQRYVAYSTWDQFQPIDPGLSYAKQGLERGDPVGQPTVRVLDRATGQDEVLEEDAYSVAWNTSGEFAYVKGIDDLVVGHSYDGHVLVREEYDRSPVPWTTAPDRYVVVQWAGERLIAYRIDEGEQLNVVVFDGPGAIRELGTGSSLVAVSPDRRSLITETIDGTDSGRGSTLRLIDIASGQTLATLPNDELVDPATGDPIPWILYSGSWVGDRIVAESPLGIVVLDAAGPSLRVEQVLRFPPNAFPQGVHEPRLLDSGNRVVGWGPVDGDDASGPRRVVYVDCDLDARHCQHGTADGAINFRPLFNPSI